MLYSPPRFHITCFYSPLHPSNDVIELKEHVDSSEHPREISTETLDDYLGYFVFQKGSVFPIKCSNPTQVIYGHLNYPDHRQKRLLLQCKGQPRKINVDAYVDVDSVLWNLQEIQLTQPIMLFPDPPRCNNLSGTHQYMQHDKLESPVLIDNTPHCLFGKIGLSISIHVIFPLLSPRTLPRGQDFLPSVLLDRWWDKVIYPSLQASLPAQLVSRFSSTRSSWKDKWPNGMMGHLLDPDFSLPLTQAMRRIVGNDEHLWRYFGGFFFHAACKGTKNTTTARMEDLLDPSKFSVWRQKVNLLYCDVFGEQAQKSMQIDLGVQFTPLDSHVGRNEHFHLLWRREATSGMRMGMAQSPRAFPWWLSKDVAGSVVSIGKKNIVDFSGPPSISYFQSYNLDKNGIPGDDRHWIAKLGSDDMTWKSSKMRKAFGMMMRGIEDGAGRTWGARMEIRMAGRHLESEADPLHFLAKCKEIQTKADEHFFCLPSLAVSRFKACTMWIIRDGAMRAAQTQVRGNGPIVGRQREEFMDILLGWFRGATRGMVFTPKCSLVFGKRTPPGEADSYGLAQAIESWNRASIPRGKVLWKDGLASLSGFDNRQQAEEGLVHGNPLIFQGLQSFLDLPSSHGPQDSGNALRSPKEAASRVVGLFLEDVLDATRAFQVGDLITRWNLAEVRRTMPSRVEKHISNRRTASTWWGLFCHLFPSSKDLNGPYIRSNDWEKIRYISLYLAQIDLFDRYKTHLPRASHQHFRAELWREFRTLDCMIRPSRKRKFVQVISGNICIDLRDKPKVRKKRKLKDGEIGRENCITLRKALLTNYL